MSKEIDDLLEINDHDSKPKIVNNSGNFAQHIYIHLGILFGLIGICYFLFESKYGSNDEIVIAIGFALLFLVFFVVLIVEIIYYQVKRKFQLRNAALISILIFILSFLIFLFSEGLF